MCQENLLISICSDVAESNSATLKIDMNRGDLSPRFFYQLKREDGTFPNLTGSSVFVVMNSEVIDSVTKQKSLVELSFSPATIANPILGEIFYDWNVLDTQTVGTFYVTIRVVFPDLIILTGRPETFPNGNDKIQLVIR